MDRRASHSARCRCHTGTGLSTLLRNCFSRTHSLRLTSSQLQLSCPILFLPPPLSPTSHRAYLLPAFQLPPLYGRTPLITPAQSSLSAPPISACSGLTTSIHPQPLCLLSSFQLYSSQKYVFSFLHLQHSSQPLISLRVVTR